MNTIRLRAASLVWEVPVPIDRDLELPAGWEKTQAPPDIVVEGKDSAHVLLGEPAFDPGVLWRLWEQDNGYLLALAAPDSKAPPFQTARMAPDICSGEVWLRNDLGSFLLRRPLDEIWISHWIGRHGGLLLHASAVAHEDVCDLCIGQSGAGKSTLAGLLTEVRGDALSDDRIVVRPVDGVWMAFGTPWHGTEVMRSAKSARIRRLLFLEHGKKAQIERISAAKAMGRLMVCSFGARWFRWGQQTMLDWGYRLVSEIPAFCLRFPLDSRMADFLDETV
ncbi:MAG: hypothetical protein V1754_00640 [Pseudomonadota bacterium]